MSLLLDTLNGIKCERPPVWFMRQAGPAIPAYRELKGRYTFKELMQTPELAAQVTLQPVEHLGVDAAILFTDILVIPEAMGMTLNFNDQGPRFTHPLKDAKNPLAILEPNPQKLQYIYDAIKVVKQKRPADIPLIGFCGGPLSLLLYMVEGQGQNHSFPSAIELLYKSPATAYKLLESITNFSIEYAREQIANGIDAFQIFDTHAGLIPSAIYEELVLPQTLRLIEAVQESGTPLIFYPKGLGAGLQMLKGLVVGFVGIDWQTSLGDAYSLLGERVGLQGNLDPRVLLQDQATITKELEKFVRFGSNHHCWIFNLGHGLLPNTPYENAKFVVDWVKSTRWNRD